MARDVDCFQCFEAQIPPPPEEDPGLGTPDANSGDPYCQKYPVLCTPIVLNLDQQDGTFRFSSVDDGVDFDLNADGITERISWTEKDSLTGFLVLDRNGNGTIDNGLELFGGVTPQVDLKGNNERNGYNALALFDEVFVDGNGDGAISEFDGVFDLLKVWVDLNHDGVSQPWEIGSLTDVGVESIGLDHVISQRRDRYGNELRWTSFCQFSSRGKKLAVADVILQSEQMGIAQE